MLRGEWLDHEFRYTSKEQDAETGLYYHGARYRDARTGVWLSVDPILEEYMPIAGYSDEARRQNRKLPGMGGVFNSVNLNLYHYAGNNPIIMIDPDGKRTVTVSLGASGTVGGAIKAEIGIGISWDHRLSSFIEKIKSFNIGLVLNGGLGGGGGYFGGLYQQIAGNDNINLSDNNGPSIDISMSGGDGIMIGGGVSFPLKYDSKFLLKPTGGNETLSTNFGIGTGFQASGIVSHTFVISTELLRETNDINSDIGSVSPKTLTSRSSFSIESQFDYKKYCEQNAGIVLK